MNPPLPAPPPDPQVVKVDRCPASDSGRVCGGPMGPLRLYQGKGMPSKRKERGSIVQTCAICHKTVHHTAAYKYEDAERLLHRILYPGDLGGFPQTLRPPTPPPALLEPQSTQATRIHCSNANCFTKSGSRTHGSRACTKNLCKTCCTTAADAARRAGEARLACQAHSQPAILATARTEQPPSTPAAPSIPAPSSQPTVMQASTVSGPQQPTSSTPAAVGNPPPAPSQVTPTQTNPAQPPATQRRRLAQPLGRAWASQHDAAVQDRANTKTLKVQQHEMDERLKRSCLLVIYYKAGESPVHINEYLTTFPQFQLSSCKQLVKEFELENTTCFDYWKGEWITLSLDGVINVEKDQRVLLKLRPSLRQALQDCDCPGVEDELRLQPKRLALKRKGEVLVSPIKKVPRQNTSPPSVRSEAAADHGPSISALQHTATWPSALPLSLDIPVPRKSNVHPCSPPPPESKPLVVKTVARKWPFEFHVHEIDAGFGQVRELMAKRNHRRCMTLEKAFSRAFPGVKFVKTTFCKYRKIWNTADDDIKKLYIDLCDAAGSAFDNFLDACHDPTRLPSLEPDDEPSANSTPEPTLEPEVQIMSKGKGKESDRDPVVESADSSKCDTLSPPNSTDSSDSPWPTNLNFEKLSTRILKRRDVINEILWEPEESPFFRLSKLNYGASSSEKPQSVHGPCGGYYGKRGCDIVISTLHDMYSAASVMSDENLEPLTWQSVISEFLLPEVVILLIEDDLEVSRDEAMTIFKKSCKGHSRNDLKSVKQERTTPSLALTPNTVIDLTSPLVKQEDCDMHISLTRDPEIIDLTLDSDEE